ncbi:MAG: hypothetical protein ACO1RT_17135 [Planctomycetaceae bacterium]
MIQRRQRNGGPALGHDAFLDVVANLVAILIILVVILGARTQEVAGSFKDDSTAQAAAPASVIDEEHVETKLGVLQVELDRAQAAFEESQLLEATIKQRDRELAAMDRERGKIIDLLEIAKAVWAEEQKKLDQASVQRAQAMSAQAVIKSELKQLEATRAQLEKTPQNVVAVSHLPTPMAKTVFGEELHFRLKGGRLSVVPIDRLVQEIKHEFQHSAVGNREGLLESAVGPVNGFVAKYQMNKSRELVSQGGSTSTATRIELVNMVIEPLEEPHGQPIDTVIAGGGTQLDIELAGRQPDRTTITVWVYPDSFADFRRLKEHLYSRGFATAARPLPMDRPISGGPQGSRSQAQ